MIRFQEMLKYMAKEKEGLEKVKETETAGEFTELGEAMNFFLGLAESGITAYNQVFNRRELSVFRLHEELLSLFLNLPDKRFAFCLTAPEKFVIFLDEQPDHILILGKKRHGSEPYDSVLTKARQLIRIGFLKTRDSFVFKDNAGGVLDPEEVMLHVIKWAVS